MPICTKLHFDERKKKTVPHYYIAGNCIHDPCNQGGFGSFLRSSYPCYQSEEYEESKQYHGELIETITGPIPEVTELWEIYEL